MRWSAVLAVVLLGGCLVAPDPPYGLPYEWSPVAEGSVPGAMHGAKLTYDENRKAIIMYAGRTVAAKVPFGTVWEWKNDQWSEICAGGDVAAGTRPAPVYLPGFAWDGDNGQLVLAGGARITQTTASIFDDVSNEVWTCDQQDVWQKQSATLKNARAGASLLFLPANRPGNSAPSQLAVVGGRDATHQIHNMELAPSDASDFEIDTIRMDFPSAGAGQSATFDRNSGHILALATELTPDDSIAPHDELWGYDGQSWTRICSSCSGVGRSDASLVHLEGTNETYLLGGYIGGGNNTSGTWIFDLDRFEKTASSPTDRNAMGVASTRGTDPVESLIMFGGTSLNDCASNECDQTYEYHITQ